MGCIIKCVLSTELQTVGGSGGYEALPEKRKKEWGVDLNEEQ